MLRCPKCGSENVDHNYSTEEIEIWCKDCGECDVYYLPTVWAAFPNWDDKNEE